MNEKKIVVTGLVGIGILIAVAIIGVLLLGDRAPPARPPSPPPAALEPAKPPPAGERQ